MVNSITFYGLEEVKPQEPVADEVDLELDTANNFTVMAGTYLVTAPIEVTGEYTYTWNVDAGYEVTVLINDVEIENGAKITYAEATEIVVTIKTSDITADINVSFVATKTPDDVVPDEEWTKNY
jgi:hypothetical protein